jgi:hypothetical protein
MSHTLIVGATLTGKTSLAKKFAETRIKSRAHVPNFRQVALDPLGSQWPEGVAVVDDWAELMLEIEIMRENEEVACIYIDEANTQFSHGDREKLWLMLRGRHFGHDLTVITQYPTLLSPAARGQCGNLHVFQIGKQSARMLAEDYACDDILRAPELRRGEWLAVEWNSKTQKRVANKYKLFEPTP